MRVPGVLGVFQLAVVLAIALPLLLFGIDWLVSGRIVFGAAFVAIAGLMLLVEWRLTNPLDPADLAETAVERVIGRRDE